MQEGGKGGEQEKQQEAGVEHEQHLYSKVHTGERGGASVAAFNCQDGQNYLYNYQQEAAMLKILIIALRCFPLHSFHCTLLHFTAFS